jgi:DNA polymerase V
MDNDFNPLALGDADGVSIHAGFPNPAADRRLNGKTLSLDLNRHLIKHPSSSYVFRISGHHWSEQGIFDGDLALIDRVLTPRPGDIVLIWQTSGFGLFRQRQLTSDEVPWGVVSAVIHQYRAPE